MPDYSSDGESTHLGTDLGSPTLAAGDRVFMGRGNQDYTNATANDMSATDLLLVETRPGWRGDFPEAAPLKIVANRSAAGRLRMQWGGRKSYVRSTSMASGVIYGIEQDPAAGGMVVLAECDVELYGLRGGVLLALSTADVSKLYAGGFGVAHLTQGGPAMAECIAGGNSTVHLERAATLISAVQGGTLKVLRDTIAPTHVYAMGGKLEYGGGNMTNLYLYGGTLDLTKMNGPLTVTNRYAYGTTRLILKQGMAEPTWTNKPVDVHPPIVEYV